MYQFFLLSIDFVRAWRTVPKLSWVRAARAHRAGLYEAAVGQYERGLLASPNHPAAFCARLDLAQCLVTLQRFQQAEDHLRLLVLQRPDDRRPYIRLVKLKMWQGLFHEAGLMAIRAAKRFAPDAELIGLAAWCFVSAGSSRELLDEAFELELALSPEERAGESVIQAARNWDWYRDGERKSSVQELHRLSHSPRRQSVEAILAYASVLIDLGLVKEAREELNRVLTLRPGYPLTMALLAQCYLNPKSYKPEFAAQLALDACRGSGWRSAQLLHLSADAQFRRGEFSTAKMMAERAHHEARLITSRYPNIAALEELISDLDTQRM
mgnify:CR=1 FL=1|jgi:predicted Zn-dependent protease